MVAGNHLVGRVGNYTVCFSFGSCQISTLIAVSELIVNYAVFSAALSGLVSLCM
jgi:hypothetical protein